MQIYIHTNNFDLSYSLDWKPVLFIPYTLMRTSFNYVVKNIPEIVKQMWIKITIVWIWLRK